MGRGGGGQRLQVILRNDQEGLKYLSFNLNSLNKIL